MTGAQAHALALSFPEVTQVVVDGWGGTMTYRVAGKIFLFGTPLGDGVTVKVGRELQAGLVQADPRVSVAPYVGRHGWVAVDLSGPVDPALWDDLADWIRTSYRLVAPRRLARLVES